MSWMWMQERKGIPSETAAEHRLQQVLDRVPFLEAKAIMTHGQAAPAILTVQREVGADLLLLGTHGATTDDHTSVTDRVIAESHCPVLALHESAIDRAMLLPDTEKPWIVLVPTDFSRQSLAAVEYAVDLAATWPMRLHLLHVVESEPSFVEEPFEEALYLRLRALLPAESRSSARCHVRFGEPSVAIADAAWALRADAIVMGGHARGLLRRFLTSDTSHGVLHRADCPVWYVPGTRAA